MKYNPYLYPWRGIEVSVAGRKGDDKSNAGGEVIIKYFAIAGGRVSYMCSNAGKVVVHFCKAGRRGRGTPLSRASKER